MEFCPKCGAVLVQKRKRDACPRCKYFSKNKVKLKTSEKIEDKKKINVISEKDSEVHPIIEQECKKCGNKKAYFWTMQTRSSDEAETKFFKCTKCKTIWRDYR
ncbi:transcription factor S [Patescibacteria group bacterium]|nr:transcription factor S [Patescibacteria group bacterium]